MSWPHPLVSPSQGLQRRLLTWACTEQIYFYHWTKLYWIFVEQIFVAVFLLFFAPVALLNDNQWWSGLKSTYVSHTCTNHLIIGNIFSILLSPGFWMKSRRMRSTNYEILCEHKIWISKKTRPISQFSLDKKRRNLGLFSYALKLGILFHNCSSCQYRTLQVWEKIWFQDLIKVF